MHYTTGERLLLLFPLLLLLWLLPRPMYYYAFPFKIFPCFA